MDQAGRLSELSHADSRQVVLQETRATRHMSRSVFRTVLMPGVLAVANVTAVVKQGGDDAEREQALPERCGAGGAHAPIHQPAHRQGHVQHVLDVVVIGIAGVVAGILAPVHAGQIAERLGQSARHVELVQTLVDARNLGRNRARISGINPVSDVELATSVRHGWTLANPSV
jgi:hypothetical protein